MSRFGMKHWWAGALLVQGLAITAACGGGGSSADPGTEADAGGKDGSPDGSTSDAKGDEGDAGSEDAPSGPRDPFAAQSRVANDFPSASDYVIDRDAGLVTDKATGLLWSRTLLTTAELPDGGNAEPTTQVEARATCASATIAGSTGWRLPTRLELLSLISMDEADVYDGTAFDTTEFDNKLLWVATDDPTRNAYYEGHYHIHTFNGNLYNAWASANVHCVKAPYSVTEHAEAPPASRFEQNGTVVADHVTHLEWFTTIDTNARLWSDADNYCTNLATADAGAPAGSKPWRLPTLKEVASLWIEATPGLPEAFGAEASTIYVWTSAHYEPPPHQSGVSGHYRFYFMRGNPSGDIFYDVDDFASTLCVRDGT